MPLSHASARTLGLFLRAKKCESKQHFQNTTPRCNDILYFENRSQKEHGEITGYHVGRSQTVRPLAGNGRGSHEDNGINFDQIRPTLCSQPQIVCGFLIFPP